MQSFRVVVSTLLLYLIKESHPKMLFLQNVVLHEVHRGALKNVTILACRDGVPKFK